MNKSLRFPAILLLSTAALGVAIAAMPVHADGRKAVGQDLAEPRESGRVTLAREGRSQHHDRQRRHHDDHDDDDEHGHGRMSTPRAAMPDAPVPDNGLFNGKAAPKAEVQ